MSKRFEVYFEEFYSCWENGNLLHEKIFYGGKRRGGLIEDFPENFRKSRVNPDPENGGWKFNSC